MKDEENARQATAADGEFGMVEEVKMQKAKCKTEGVGQSH
jgi:hypothetical protein